MNATPQRTFAEPATRVRLRPQSIAWRRVADDIVVLDIDRSRYHAINQSGAAVWELLESGTTIDALVGALTDAYPEASVRVSEDLQRFLGDLDERGMLEVSADGPSPGNLE